MVSLWNCDMIGLITIRVIITTLLSSGKVVDSVFTNIIFDKGEPIHGDIVTDETINKMRSRAECAVACERKIPVCVGFEYHPATKTCDIYKYNWGNSITFVPNANVYHMQDLFHAIPINGQLFTFYQSTVSIEYSDARVHCQALGGYLLEFNSLDEYKAVEMIVSGFRFDGSYTSVGFNDIAVEGQWVRDRDGTIPRPEDLVWFEDQPDNDGDENCAAVYHEPPYTLIDNYCYYYSHFSCEKDG